MIKNIIFDLGNVIVQNPNIDTVKKFFKEEDDAIIFNNYIFKSEFWKMMDLGKITNLEIANSIGIKGRRVNPNDSEDIIKLLLENNIKIK